MGIEQEPTVRESLEHLATKLRDPFGEYHSEADWDTVPKQLQHAFLPANPAAPEGYDLYVSTRTDPRSPSDLYDVVTMPDACIFFGVGDLCGYGPGAMPVGIALFEAIRSMARAGGTPGEIARVMDDAQPQRPLATLFLAVLDPKTHRMNYANAGHEPALVLSCDGAIARLESSGPPIGFNVPIEREDVRIDLQPGELLVAFSDGIVEASRWRDGIPGEPFGHETLQKILVESRSASVAEIGGLVFAAVDDFVDAAETREEGGDDKTLMLLRRLAPESVA